MEQQYNNTFCNQIRNSYGIRLALSAGELGEGLLYFHCQLSSYIYFSLLFCSSGTRSNEESDGRQQSPRCNDILAVAARIGVESGI